MLIKFLIAFFKITRGSMIKKIGRVFETYVKNIVTRDESFSSNKLE